MVQHDEIDGLGGVSDEREIDRDRIVVEQLRRIGEAFIEGLRQQRKICRLEHHGDQRERGAFQLEGGWRVNDHEGRLRQSVQFYRLPSPAHDRSRRPVCDGRRST
jgi:hypothetical protein